MIIMKVKKYEAKDEDELLNLLDKDLDKFTGWEGPTETHLRSVRYPPKNAKGTVRPKNK